MKLDSLKSMEEFKSTLPPVYWGYEVREYPKEYFKKNFLKKIYVEKLKSSVAAGKSLFKPISKF